MKTFSKKKLIIAIVLSIAIVGLTAAAIIVGVTNYNKDPKVKLKKGIESFTEQLCERNEIAPLVQAVQNGMISLSFNSKPDGADTLAEDIISFGADIYMKDLGEEVFIDNGFFWDGEKDSRFNAYLASDYGYLDGEIFGGLYGYKRGDMESAFVKSPFFTTGTYLSLSQESKEQYKNIFALYDEGYDKKFEEDVLEYGKKYYKSFMKSLFENSTISEGRGSVLPEGAQNSREAMLIVLKIDRDGIVAMLSSLYDEIYADEKLRDAAIEHLEAYAKILGTKLDDPSLVYYEELANFKFEIEEIKNEYPSDYCITFSLARDKETNEVFYIALKSNDGKEETTLASISVEGESVEKATALSVFMDKENYKYSIIKDTESEYSASFTKDDKVIFEFDLSKENEKYSLLFYENGTVKTLELEGDWETEDGKTTVTVNKVQSKGEKVWLTAKVSIDTAASMPKPEKVEHTVFEMTRDNMAKYLFTSEISDLRLSGLYEDRSIDIVRMSLDFDGLNVILKVREDDGSYSTYSGYYVIDNEVMTFYFYDDEPYSYFSRSGNDIAFYSHPETMVIGRYRFFKR